MLIHVTSCKQCAVGAVEPLATSAEHYNTVPFGKHIQKVLKTTEAYDILSLLSSCHIVLLATGAKMHLQKKKKYKKVQKMNKHEKKLNAHL